MVCPNCSTTMEEVSHWKMAPYGGWECPNCGLKIAKKSLSKWFKIIRFKY